VKFHLQKSFWDFESLITSYGQISDRVFEVNFFKTFQIPGLKFVHNFWLVTRNIKRIFGCESSSGLKFVHNFYFIRSEIGCESSSSLKFWFLHKFEFDYILLLLLSSLIPYALSSLLPPCIYRLMPMLIAKLVWALRGVLRWLSHLLHLLKSVCHVVVC